MCDMLRRDLKVMYCSYQPYALQIGIKMHARYGWNPVYWFSDHEVEPLIRKNFPAAVCHNYIKAIKGIRPADMNDLAAGVVDESLLNDLAVDESIAINMMERNDSTDR